MPKGSAVLLGFVLLLIAGGNSAIALPIFLDEWRKVYPDSNSDRTECQLCHLSESGDEPWNAYGFDIREEYIRLSRLNMRAAITGVETINSDGDPEGLSNLMEIEQSLDPGWKLGDQNIVFFRDRSSALFSPPISNVDQVSSSDTDFCFVIANTIGKVVSICL